MDSNKTVKQSISLPCLISTDGDINTPRLPSYKVKRTLTDEVVRFLSLEDFSDRDPSRYGLNGSATQVERIFPPEKNTEKHTVSGSSEEQADKIAELISKMKLI